MLFDSDFELSDDNDTTELDDEIEVLDTPDIERSMTKDVEEDDSPATEELDDGFYHATRMSEEEIGRIDELWDEREKKAPEIEPYRAERHSDVEQEDEVRETYRATRQSGSSEISGEMSDASDVPKVEMLPSIEDQFAAEIEAMSFDDLSAEQARLDSLSQMDNMDIFAEYDERQHSEYDPDLLAALTDGMPRETLEHLTEGLKNGDPDVFDYFGLSSSEDDNHDGSPTLSRKR